MAKIKVVFQGGGARLVSLLAAADILQTMEKNDQVEIVSVAGVSAGAIAAAMLASDIDSELFRTNFARYGEPLIDSFPAEVGFLRLVSSLFFGKAVYPESTLRDLLTKVFCSHSSENRLLGSVKKPLIITASNVRYGEKVTYDSRKNKELHLIDALVDSCALPFAFRTFKDKQLLVDGGLSGNLPVDEILELEPDVPTLAIGFGPEKPDEIKTAGGYALALLSTAIDSATTVAFERVKAKGGEACKLPSIFGTFEFKPALAALTGEGYKSVKARVHDAVEQSITNIKARDGAVTFVGGHSDIGRAHRNLINQFPYTVARSTTVIIANCLSKSVPHAYPSHDTRQHIVQYKATGAGLVAIRLGLSISTPATAPTVKRQSLSLLTKDGKEIPHEYINVDEEIPNNNNFKNYFTLIFLNNMLSTDESVTAVQEMYVPNCMMAIATRGWDWMRSQVKHNYPISELILLCPQDFDKLELSDLYDKLSIIPREEGQNLEVPKKAWMAGRPMTQAELKERLPLTPPGYKLYGWCAENVPIDSYFGCYIQRIKGSRN